MPFFDLNAARKAGHDDSTILAGLASQTKGFDLKAARESGYDDKTILEGLRDHQYRGEFKALNPSATDEDLDYLTQDRIKTLDRPRQTKEENIKERERNRIASGDSALGAKINTQMDVRLEDKFNERHPDINTPVRGDVAARQREGWQQNYEATRPVERTTLEAVGDTGAQIMKGGQVIAGAVPSLIAPESDPAQFFKKSAEFWNSKYSESLKRRDASANRAISAAGEDGIVAQMAEAASQYWDDPGLAAKFVFENLPSMIPGIAVTKVAQAAALARGATALKAAGAATTAGGLTNAVLNGGGARGEAFEDIKATLMQRGMSEADATEVAKADSLLPAVIGAGTGFLSGKTGLEKAIVGGPGIGGALRRGVTAGAVELGGEQLEEVAPKLATNYQAGQYDNRSLGKDVGRTMVETAIGSGPGAVLAGGVAALDGQPVGQAATTQGATQEPVGGQMPDIAMPPAAPIPGAGPGVSTQGVPAQPEVTARPLAGISDFEQFMQQERDDIQQRRMGIVEKQAEAHFADIQRRMDSELETTDARVQGGMQRTAQERRIADIEQAMQSPNPMAAFADLRTSQDLPILPEDVAIIKRRMGQNDAFQALPEGVEPSLPNEAQNLVPERREPVQSQPATDRIQKAQRLLQNRGLRINQAGTHIVDKRGAKFMALNEGEADQLKGATNAEYQRTATQQLLEGDQGGRDNQEGSGSPIRGRMEQPRQADTGTLEGRQQPDVSMGDTPVADVHGVTVADNETPAGVSQATLPQVDAPQAVPDSLPVESAATQAEAVSRLRKDSKLVLLGDISPQERADELTAIDAVIVAAVNANIPEEKIHDALFAQGVTSKNLAKLLQQPTGETVATQPEPLAQTQGKAQGTEGKTQRPYADNDAREDAIARLEQIADDRGMNNQRDIRESAEYGASEAEIQSAIERGEDALDELSNTAFKRNNGMKQGFGPGNNDAALIANMKPLSERAKAIEGLLGLGLYEMPEADRAALLKAAKVKSVDAFENIARADRKEIIEKWVSGTEGKTEGVANTGIDAWRSEFDSAKQAGDNARIQALYDKARVALNGIAQARGAQAVADLEALKTDIEEYAKSVQVTPPADTKTDEVSAFEQRFPNIAAAEKAIKDRKLKQVAVFKDGDQYRIGAKSSNKQAPSDNLIQRIKQMGGIHTRNRNDVIGDKSGAPGLFSNNGKGLDDLATELHAEGFDIDVNTVDGGVEILTDLIRRAVMGETILNFEGQERAEQKRQNDEYRDNLKEEIEKLGGNPARNATTAKLIELRDKLRAELNDRQKMKKEMLVAIIGDDMTPADWELLIDTYNATEFDYDQDVDAIRATEQEREASRAAEAEYEGQNEEVAGRRDTGESRQDNPVGRSGADNQGAQELILTGETAEEVKAKEESQAAKAKAEKDAADKVEADAKKKRIANDDADRKAVVMAEREAAKKAEVDAAVENYALGQEPPKPVEKAVNKDQLAGQGGLFAQPQAQPKPDNQQSTFDLFKDGIAGEEVAFDRVPNGNEEFQYALGRTEADGYIAVFRRPAGQRGSYGGWRWEADANKLNTAQKAPDGAERFEAGSKLTKEERKSVLKTLTDVYRSKQAEKEERIAANGETYLAYPHQPELFEKSDITGKMVRFYVTMPDGRIAHPTELFPDYSQADVDRVIAKQVGEDRVADQNKKGRLETLNRRMADTLNEANRIFNKENPGHDYVSAILTNGKQFIRTAPENAAKDVELLGGDWRIQGSAESTEAKPADTPAKQDKIEDFGEKLPPARRAMAAKLNEDLTDEAIESQPLSKIWPLKENEEIEDTFAAAVASVMRENIPAKPRKGYKLNSWVEKVKTLREMTANVLSGVVSKENIMAELGNVSALRSLGSKIKLLEQIDRAQWDRIGDVTEAPDALRYVDGKPIRVPQAFVKIDGKNNWLQESGDINDHIDAINSLLAGDAPDVRMQFEIRRERSGNKKVFINKKGDKEYRRLMEFDTVAEASKAMKDQYNDLVAAWDGVKGRDYINERDLRSEENRPRAGKDHRKGKDISAEEFQDAFGFKGGEFGKWVSQGKNAQERQFFLNSAYDAFMDLADILGIPPKAISLEGTLGVAFGSRGSGWASAHFEPSNLVINLTKPRGAGALAHEWFHAMDNYFARKRGGEVAFTGDNKAYRDDNFITHKTTPMMVRKDGKGSPVTRERLAEWRKSSPASGYLTESEWMPDPNHKEGVRAEVEGRFNTLVNVLNQSPMLNRSKKLERSGDYWSRTLERAARSFENYIMTRMMEQGYHNDFLANVKNAESVGKSNDRYPYLLPEEIAPVAEAFDNLFNTIQTKETDKGVAMFSRRPAFFSPLSKAVKTAKQDTMPAAQWKLWLQGNKAKLGLKDDELTFSGVLDYLDIRGKDKVTKAEIADYLSGSGVRVEDVVKGDSEQPLQWEDAESSDTDFTESYEAEFMTRDGYTDKVGLYYSPSADGWFAYFRGEAIAEDTSRQSAEEAAQNAVRENGEAMQSNTKFSGYWDSSYKGGIPDTYREILVTLPEKSSAGKFKSGHWDEPNVLVHIRTDEVMGADGKRYLRVGEIQSDFGQAGRKEGFKGRTPTDAEVVEYFGLKEGADPAEYRQEMMDGVAKKGVPNAPFVTDTRAWVSLGIKRAIMHSLDVGADGVVFGTGQQNADLYDLSKQVDSVTVRKSGNGWKVYAAQRGATVIDGRVAENDSELADMVGKDLAERAIGEGGGKYEGVDLKVGGSGMRAFYDQIVPSVANEVLRKVGGGEVGMVEAEGQQFGFTITQEMRENLIEQGITLFARNAGQGIAKRDAQAIVDVFKSVNSNSPPIIVLEDVSKAPQSLIDEIQDAGAENDVEGAFHEGTIYLFPQNLESADRAAAVLTHEGRHFAFKAMKGKALDSILMSIYNTNERVLRMADAKKKSLKLDSLVEATEEALADLDPATLQGLKGWRMLIAHFRLKMREFAVALRKAGLTTASDWLQSKLNGWTDADVAAMLRNSDRFVRSGRGQGEGNMRMSRTGDTITVDGKQRSRLNSNGKPIAATEEGLRNPDIRFSRRQIITETAEAHQSAYAEKNRIFREEHITYAQKAKTWLRRQFMPGGLLKKAAFDAKIARDNELASVEFDSEHMIATLERAVEADYGTKLRDQNMDSQKLLSEALAGRIPENLGENTKVALLGMRQYIDNMTEKYLDMLWMQADDYLSVVERMRAEVAVYSDLLRESTNEQEKIGLRKTIASMTAKANGQEQEANSRIELIDVMSGNIGEYVHRSYRAFDDPDWAKKIPDKVLDDAREYLTIQFIVDDDMTEAEAANRAEIVMNEIVKNGTAYESLEGFIHESKLGAKDLSVLKKRKQIAHEIRALLGQYEDPRLNFAKSTAKMSRLIFNQQFLERIKEVGMGEFLFTDDNKPPEATTKIAGDKSAVYAPLNGLWVTPETNQAFIDALGKEQMEDWYRTIVRINGMIKYGKTVISPTTAMRNWMSAYFFTLANGHFNMRDIAKSVAGFKEYFGHRSEPEKLAYLRELKQLGVVYDTPYAGEMMRLLDDAKVETLMMSKRWQSAKALMDQATKFYQYGDDFWKIVGYENEKRMLMSVGFTEADAKVKAANRIRNTYPTYSMVGRGIQQLRRFPLAGTFVSFPAEIIRTSYNIVTGIADEYKDPRTRPLVARRVIGLSIATGFAYGLQALSMAMLGMDDDDEEAARLMSAPWQRNSNLAFFGSDDDGRVRYMDMSFLDPYNYWKRPIIAASRGLPWRQAVIESVTEMTKPFLGVDILAGSIFEVLSNKKDSGGRVFQPHDDISNVVVDIADHLRKAIQPGIAANIERTYKATQGEVTKSGKEYDIVDETAAWFGFRMSTLDPKVALYYRGFDFKDAKIEADKHVRDALSDQNDVGVGELKSAINTTKRQRAKAFNDAILLVNAAKKNGMSTMEIRVTLKNSGISQEDIRHIISGKPPEFKLTMEYAIRVAEKSKKTFGIEGRKRVMERYRALKSYSEP